MIARCSPLNGDFRLRLSERCRWPSLGFLTIHCLVMLSLIHPGEIAAASGDGPGKPASAVAFSPTGEAIVTGHEDGALTLWDRQSGKPARQFKSEATGITMMASSPSADSVAVGAADGTIELWDVERGRCRRTLREHEAAITALAFSEDGELLASGSSDRTIKLWEVQSGRLLKSTREGRSAIRALSFSPDGQILASDGDETNVRLWKVQTGDLLGTLKGHDAPIAGVAISADGELLAASSAEGLLVWNMKRRQSPPIGVEGGARTLVFSPRPHVSLLASVTDDEIWLWNVEQERRAGALKGHTGRIKTLAFAPDGKQIVSLGSDNTVRLWSLRPNEALLVINTLSSEAQSPSASSASAGGGAEKVELATPLPPDKESERSPSPPPSAPAVVPKGGGSPHAGHTLSSPPSHLEVAQVVLGEVEKDSRSQSRDRVEIAVSVTNPGPGTVDKARAKLNFGPGVAFATGSPEEFDLGEMAPGAVKVLKFACVLGGGIRSGMRIPISVIFTTEFDQFVKEEPLNLVMHAAATQPQSVEPASPVKAAPPPEKPVLSDEQRRELAREYYEKGNVSYEARDYEEAASSYTRAIELEDSFAPLFYNLAMTQRALHRNPEAVRNFKRYLVLRPDAPNASEVLQMIEVLGE